MLDILVAEVSLQTSRIDTVIGELVAAAVPQHVRMNWDVELGGDTEPSDHFT
jgi:hypothetical protein